MSNSDWEKIRDELEVIQNTANYGIDCVNDEDELKQIMQEIKRSYGIIAHTMRKNNV